MTKITFCLWQKTKQVLIIEYSHPHISHITQPHCSHTLTEYDKLLSSEYQRDNFYVRCRYSHHHKSRTEFGLEYSKLDVFRVIDSHPQGSHITHYTHTSPSQVAHITHYTHCYNVSVFLGYSGFWQVEKVKRSPTEDLSGFIPITLE